MPDPQEANEAPVTVVVLPPLTKLGTFPEALIGAKLTVAVTAGAEEEIVPEFATR